MSDNGEVSGATGSTDPTRTGNVGPGFAQGSATGSNYSSGPLESAATSGAAPQGPEGTQTNPVRTDDADDETITAGGQGSAGLAAAASHGDGPHPGLAGPRGATGTPGVGEPAGQGGPGSGGAMGEGGPTNVTTVGEQ